MITAKSASEVCVRTTSLLVAVLAFAALPSPAEAQCVRVGSTVACTGLDTNGFPNDPAQRPPVAPGDDGLDITVVSGAVVENSGAGATILLLDDNVTTIESGATVTAIGGKTAILGGGTATTRNLVTNSGMVRASGSGSVGIDLGSAGEVLNGGLVEAGGGPNVIGIRVGAGGEVENLGVVEVDGVDAVGIVTNALDHVGTTTATGDGAVGVRLEGNGAFARNSGLIEGGSGLGAGVRMAEPPPGVPELKIFLNEGTGLVDAASGVAILGSEGQDQVVNRGQLAGHVRLAGGDDRFDWGTGSAVTGVLDGGAGNDVIQLFQSVPSTPTSGTFNLDAPQNFERLFIGNPGDTGTWTLTGSGAGRFPGGITVVSGEVLTPAYRFIDGDVNVQGGTYQFGFGHGDPRRPAPSGIGGNVSVAGPGRLMLNGVNVIGGDLDLTQGGVLVTHFSSTGGGGGGSLEVYGAARVSGGVLQLVQSDTGSVVPRTIGRIRVRGSLEGEFSGVSVFGATGFVRARLSYEEDPPFFEQEEWIVIQVTSGYAALARSHNERAVGTFLDQAVAIGVDPDFQSFLDSLNPITNDEYTNVLDMLHGAAYDAQTSTALATGSRYAAMLAERPPRCDRPVTPYRRDQPSLDPCGLRLLTPWVKGFGLFSDHDASEEDWSHAGGGVAFGADQRVPGDFILSGLVGTSRSVLDLEHGGDGSYTSLDIGAGIAWQRDPWHVRGTLVYAHGWHETYRQIDSPLFAQPDGSHESDGVTLLADGGYTFVLSPFELEPIVGLEYSHLAQGSIDESGGGVVDLEVDSRSDDLFATNAGIRAGATLAGRGDLGAWSKGLWRSEVRASWRQVWTGYDREFDAQLAGAPGGTPSFQVETQDAQYGAILGGGISFQPEGSHTTIGIDYDAFVGEDTLAHTVLATLRVPF